VTTENNLEIEIKIKIDDVAEIRKKLEDNGFRLITSRSFEHNIVFDTPKKKLKKNSLLLRLRRADNKNIVTFKRPSEKAVVSSGYKIREEIETEVSDYEAMKTILTGLGYKPVFIYEKYREEFRKEDVAVMVDETPVGNFVEIEGTAAAIDGTAVMLGYDKGDYITANYRTLFKKAGLTGHMQFGEERLEAND
jgi:adenylate cyclase class 2